MRQLSAFDAQFLSETGNTLAHYTGITILEPDEAGMGVTRDEVVTRVSERLQRLDPLRWQLQAVPLGLDHPVFVEVDVDVEAHVYERPAPAPGTDRELADIVAEILENRLDRDRPLWRIDVVTGLSGNRSAVLTTLHHAVADGVAAAAIFGELMIDAAPRGGPVAQRAAARPTRADLFVRGVRRTVAHPLRSASAGVGVLPHLDQSPSLRSIPGVARIAGAARGVERLAARATGATPRPVPTVVAAPRSRFNGPLSATRTVAFASMPLHVVKDHKNAHGVTFNDIVIAAVAGGLRRRMEATGDLPDAPLVAFVPTSVRAPAADGGFGNAISSFVVPIPTHRADPARRIRFAHRSMEAAKERHKGIPTTLLADMNGLIPPILFGTVAGVAMRLMDSGQVAPPVNLTISNVPGPPFRVTSFGRTVAAQYPASLIFGGVGLNVTVVSYDDQLEIGMVGDGELLPDLHELVGDVCEEFAALHAAIS
jgi:WS/DGAT/MGAT family acyltransferase